MAEQTAPSGIAYIDDSTGSKATVSTSRCGPMGFDTEILISEYWEKTGATNADAT